MPELRISELSAGPAGRRRVQVTWQDGMARRVAVAEFDEPDGAADREPIRWYLEHYPEFPVDPAPRRPRAQLHRRTRTTQPLTASAISRIDCHA